MAYYDSFKTKWAQAPAGTTQSKLDWVNAATATGPAVPMKVPYNEIYNRLDRAEYNLLPKPEDKASVQRHLAQQTIDFGPGSAARAQFFALFPSGISRTNLNNYVKQFDQPTVLWWTTANQPPDTPYTRPFDMGDVTAAGVS